MYFKTTSFAASILVILLGLCAETANAQCPPAPANYGNIPYFTSFENGFDNVWLLVEQNGSEIDTFPEIVSTSWGTATPFTGSYMLGMHQPNGPTYAQNESWLRLDLCGEDSVFCSFKWMEWNDETETQDGVFFSDDGGTNFVKVLDLNGASYPDLTWQSFTLNVDSLCAVYNLSLTEEFVIKFQQYDNYYFNGGNDGHFYDDIDVYSLNIADTNAGLSAVIAPGDTVCGNDDDTLRLVVTNNGEDDIINIFVLYEINAGPPAIAGIVPGPLSTGQSDTLEVTGVPYTTPGTYEIVSYLLLAGDSVTSNDTNSTVFENLAVPNPPTEIAGDTVCFGQELELIGFSGMGQTTIWLDTNNGNTLAQVDTFHPNASLPGIYAYHVAAFDGFCTSDLVLVEGLIEDAFDVQLTTAGSVNKCPYEEINLSTVNAYNTYQWSNNSAASSITVIANGQYYVGVIDNNNCIGYSDTLTVTNYPATPQPTIVASPSETACTGDTIELSTSANGTLLWNDANNSSTSTIAVTNAGGYIVQVTDANGCMATSDTTFLTFLQSPEVLFTDVPEKICIKNVYDLTGFASPGGGIWVGNDVNQPLFTPDSVQTYTLSYTVTATNGCTDEKSIELNAQDCTIGMFELSSDDVSIWPNPTSGLIHITSNKAIALGSITIFDLAGRALKTEVNVTNPTHLTLDLSTFPAGGYMIQMEVNGVYQTKRLLLR